MKALDGIRILDLSHAMAGPLCSMFLGALGAEVIKIEPPWGEMSRSHPPLVKQTSPYFVYTSRQKKGITLNLKTSRGKEIFKDLVKISDIVLENFSPSTMEQLGLGYKVLKEINPRIIYATISGFGQYGPWSDRLSFNSIAQAASGYMELSREKMDLSSPKVTPEAIADTIPALFCMTGILAAIIHREKTGQGQMIDVAQLDSMIAVFPSVVFHSMSGISFGESVKQRSLLGGTLRCKDGYVQCAIPLRRLHDRLLDALRKEVDGVEIDKEKLKDWAKLNTVDRVVEVLIKAKVPVAPILSLPAAIKSPQIKAREMIVEIEHPLIGKTKSPGFPIKFSESPGKIDMPSPLLGQHNEEVFIKLMGYSKDEIMELREEGVI